MEPLRKRGGQFKHGGCLTPEYKSWGQMLNRCRNPNAHNFKHYGGRGVTVCERWKQFANFLADMGPRPHGHSIDRRDNNGNYEPGNCFWATKEEQARNKRTSRSIECRGRRMRLQEAAEIVGISRQRLMSRLDSGWTDYQAAETPVGGVEGEDHVNAKLTADDVRFIRTNCGRGRSAGYRAMARKFGVDPATIRRAVLGKSWSALNQDAPSQPNDMNSNPTGDSE